MCLRDFLVSCSPRRLARPSRLSTRFTWNLVLLTGFSSIVSESVSPPFIPFSCAIFLLISSSSRALVLLPFLLMWLKNALRFDDSNDPLVQWPIKQQSNFSLRFPLREFIDSSRRLPDNTGRDHLSTIVIPMLHLILSFFFLEKFRHFF